MARFLPEKNPEFLREVWERYEQCAFSLNGLAAAYGRPNQTVLHWLKVCRKVLGVSDGVRALPQVGSPAKKEMSVPSGVAEKVKGLMKKGSMSLEEIASVISSTRGAALDVVDAMRAEGLNILEISSRFSIDRTSAPAFVDGELPTYVSRPDNTYIFGATSDNHMGSKYERMDVVEDLYDRFAMAEVDRVFNAGNWIDGFKTNINAHDVHIGNMEGQLVYLAEKYPKRDGTVTYAVTGEDHEGWWARSEGIDIGKRAEQTMREHGRTDWVNLGFMESHVRLVNANTGKEAILAVVHPGGGTGYALSYTVQKIIEALEGGEKPAVALYGHYHKLWAGNIRNVWVCMTGCTQDQTVFTRNKIKQEVHVGGVLIGLEQDPDTGAIIGFAPKMMRYFVKGYYANNRWSKHGSVTLPKRVIA